MPRRLVSGGNSAHDALRGTMIRIVFGLAKVFALSLAAKPDRQFRQIITNLVSVSGVTC